MAITLSAGSAANGINFNTYFDNYFPNNGEPHGGNPVFYGGSSVFDGDQIALTYPNDDLILCEGNDLNYTFATHVLAGELDSLTFGTYGDDYYVDDDGLLQGYVDELTVSGLDLYSPAGVIGDVHNIIYGLMSSDPSYLEDYIASQAQIVYGSAGKDTYTGTQYNDRAYGYDGNDVFKGGAGNDTLNGGNGNDNLNGGAGNDNLIGGSGDDKMVGAAGDDDLNGGAGSDTLDGSGGLDVINGSGGADILTGGLGKDTLTGGGASDTFVYAAIGDSTAGANGRDLITDFANADKIDLSAIDADETRGGNQEFVFAGAKFTKTAGEVIAVVSDEVTFIRADVDGDGQSDFSIEVDSAFNFKESHFLL